MEIGITRKLWQPMKQCKASISLYSPQNAVLRWYEPFRSQVLGVALEPPKIVQSGLSFKKVARPWLNLILKSSGYAIYWKLGVVCHMCIHVCHPYLLPRYSSKCVVLGLLRAGEEKHLVFVVATAPQKQKFRKTWTLTELLEKYMTR